MKQSIQITWYGRCCFLIEMSDKKVLFDPYDLFCNVDIGLIEADILLSSSSWHDHGHIGASPGARVYTYPGAYERFGIQITGIESREDRGTPNIIFNIRNDDFSITNFADFGPTQAPYFDAHVTDREREVLQSTTIALVRPMIERENTDGVNIHNENFLRYCAPQIIIPGHYHPREFIATQIPQHLLHKFEPANQMVDELPAAIGYPVSEIDDYHCTIGDEISAQKTIYRFLQVHPQVKYRDDIVIKRNW